MPPTDENAFIKEVYAFIYHHEKLAEFKNDSEVYQRATWNYTTDLVDLLNGSALPHDLDDSGTLSHLEALLDANTNTFQEEYLPRAALEQWFTKHAPLLQFKYLSPAYTDTRDPRECAEEYLARLEENLRSCVDDEDAKNKLLEEELVAAAHLYMEAKFDIICDPKKSHLNTPHLEELSSSKLEEVLKRYKSSRTDHLRAAWEAEQSLKTAVGFTAGGVIALVATLIAIGIAAATGASLFAPLMLLIIPAAFALASIISFFVANASAKKANATEEAMETIGKEATEPNFVKAVTAELLHAITIAAAREAEAEEVAGTPSSSLAATAAVLNTTPMPEASDGAPAAAAASNSESAAPVDDAPVSISRFTLFPPPTSRAPSKTDHKPPTSDDDSQRP